MTDPAFALRGIYFHEGFLVDPPHHAPLTWDLAQWQAQLRWLQACGINAVEFATMLEFNRHPSTPLEERKIADRLRLLDLAHSLGMQFGYLLSNTDARLPELACSLADAEVESAAAGIRPNPSPDLPLPGPASQWLADLRRSLPRLAQIP